MVTALVAGAVLLAASFTAAALVARVGARPLLLAGGAASAGGTYWLSLVTEHSTYAGGLLGPMLVTGAGLGLLSPTPARWRPASTGPSSSPPGSHCSSWSSRSP